MKHPGQKDDLPTMRRSLLAFVDIMGYSSLLRQKDANQQSEELIHLHRTLRTARDFIGDPSITKYKGSEPFAMRAFTDNIVISWPIHDDGEQQLGMSYYQLSLFQLSMIREGYFVRGGLALGSAYIDDVAVFGPALLEAYQVESKIARNPRIACTDDVLNLARGHLGYYSEPEDSPQARSFLMDRDGTCFLHYLDAAVATDGDVDNDLIAEHRDAIMRNLELHGNDPQLRGKYRWCALYHNFHCRENDLDNELQVPLNGDGGGFYTIIPA